MLKQTNCTYFRDSFLSFFSKLLTHTILLIIRKYRQSIKDRHKSFCLRGKLLDNHNEVCVKRSVGLISMKLALASAGGTRLDVLIKKSLFVSRAVTLVITL